MSESGYVWPETYMTRRDLFRVLSYAAGAVAVTGAIGLALRIGGSRSDWFGNGIAAETALLAGGLVGTVIADRRSRVNARRFDATFAAAKAIEEPLSAKGLRMELDETVGDLETRRLSPLGHRAFLWTIFWVAVLTAGAAGALRAMADSSLPAYDTNSAGHGLLVLGSILALASGAVIGVNSLLAATRWPRRYRSVVTTGWREARATGRPRTLASRRGSPADLRLDFPDGSETHVSTWDSTCHVVRPYRDRHDVPVWVGGEGQDMVVLFPRGRFSAKRYAVPAAWMPGARTDP
ncbi:hypothetical protein [Amycolatopsis sp. lyj-90]|uniref:hypothetical protein n=1 Tax=Amycolatopsis sp. lyj-90 TaxID=2789285 RepID=UPI003979C552